MEAEIQLRVGREEVGSHLAGASSMCVLCRSLWLGVIGLYTGYGTLQPLASDEKSSQTKNMLVMARKGDQGSNFGMRGLVV